MLFALPARRVAPLRLTNRVASVLRYQFVTLPQHKIGMRRGLGAVLNFSNGHVTAMFSRLFIKTKKRCRRNPPEQPSLLKLKKPGMH